MTQPPSGPFNSDSLGQPMSPVAPPIAQTSVPHFGGASAAPSYNTGQGESTKSFIVTWILSYLLGVFGADRFYLGKIGTAIAKLLTFGGLGVWWLIDLILTLAGAQKDRFGLKLAGYEKHKKLAWIVTGALIVLGLIFNAVTPKPEPATFTAPPAVQQPPVIEDMDGAETVEKAEEKVESTPEPATPAEPVLSAECKSAIRKAESYSQMLHMSKAGILDQLTSEYGEKFSAEAGQCAMDNFSADWNANALAKAKSYQDMMAMSPDAIWEQLTSPYGEQFTAEEADYAIANLNN